MANRLSNGLRAPVDVGLQDLDAVSKRAIVIPNATDVSYDPGLDVTEVPITTPLGISSTVSIYPQTQNPRITMTFPRKTPEALAMKMGMRLEERTDVAAYIVRNGMLVKGTSYPPATEGFEGFGMVADQTGTIASYLDDDGISIPMTRGAFAGFSSTTSATGFAQGADFALKFGNTIVGKYATIFAPITLDTAIVLGEQAFNRFALRLVTIMDDMKLVQFTFPEVIVDPSEGEVNFTEASVPMTFRILYDGSGCVPVQVKWIGQARKCLEPIAA